MRNSGTSPQSAVMVQKRSVEALEKRQLLHRHWMADRQNADREGHGWEREMAFLRERNA